LSRPIEPPFPRLLYAASLAAWFIGRSYLLKESLERLWDYRYEGAMFNHLQKWMDQLKWQRLTPFEKLADILLKHLEGILNYCRTKVRFGVVEAVNGNIRMLINRGRGYKNLRYLLLKAPADRSVQRRINRHSQGTAASPRDSTGATTRWRSTKSRKLHIEGLHVGNLMHSTNILSDKSDRSMRSASTRPDYLLCVRPAYCRTTKFSL
jgi:hypothetical protein